MASATCAPCLLQCTSRQLALMAVLGAVSVLLLASHLEIWRLRKRPSTVVTST